MRRWRQRYGIGNGPAPAAMVVRRIEDICKQLRRAHGRNAAQQARLRLADVQQIGGDPTALRIWEGVVKELESDRRTERERR